MTGETPGLELGLGAEDEVRPDAAGVVAHGGHREAEGGIIADGDRIDGARHRLVQP